MLIVVPRRWGRVIGDQAGFLDLADRLAGLSKTGDPLERLARVVDFEIFRGRAGPGAGGGRRDRRIVRSIRCGTEGGGYFALSRQVIDASIVEAPKQRLTDGEKARIKAGKPARSLQSPGPGPTLDRSDRLVGAPRPTGCRSSSAVEAHS